MPEGWQCEKVVLGAGSLACSYRAECAAMEAGLKRLVNAIALSKTRRTRVPEFTDSLPLLMALSAGPAVVGDAMLRRVWDLTLHIVRLRASVNFQFVISHFGVPRDEAAGKAAEQGARSRTLIRRGPLTSSLVWRGRCGTRCTGALGRTGRHARIAVCYSIALGQRRSTPRWTALVSRYWRSLEQAPRSISGGRAESSHPRWARWSADGAARRSRRVTRRRNSLGRGSGKQ
ncbi:hypothetical protein ERJ75_001533600 [Trypanosoma vivax]|nr:hypothetical protein ERJ75_001533600 [Trypanosoma vivax]